MSKKSAKHLSLREKSQKVSMNTIKDKSSRIETTRGRILVPSEEGLNKRFQGSPQDMSLSIQVSFGRVCSKHMSTEGARIEVRKKEDVKDLGDQARSLAGRWQSPEATGAHHFPVFHHWGSNCPLQMTALSLYCLPSNRNHWVDHTKHLLVSPSTVPQSATPETSMQINPTQASNPERTQTNG